MTARLIVQPNPCSAVDRREGDIESGITLGALLAAQTPLYKSGEEQPALISINGEFLAPADWHDRMINPGDVVLIKRRPEGFTAFVYIIGAALAAYAYLNMPEIPDLSNNYYDTPEQSPTYDANVQRNTARLNQPVPVGYGEQWIVPDLAAQPFRRYIGGDQYLFHVFSIGQGVNHILEKRVGNTSVYNYEGFEDQVVQPGEKVTLFHPDMVTSSEANNINLFAPNDPQYSDFSGPYVLTEPGQDCIGVEFDWVCRGGLYERDKKTGDYSSASISLLYEVQEIDENNGPVGGWQAHSVYISRNTIETLRTTVALELPAGRYQFRIRRSSNSKDPSNQMLMDEIQLGQLRAVIESDAVFDHAVWAVKIKVSDQLAGAAEREFKCKRQRWLETWDGLNWTAPQATRNPAWAFCDVTRAAYGGNDNDTALDLVEIKRLADVWDARGDYFDYQFDTRGTVDQARKLICAVGRAVPVEYNGKFSIVRDEPKQVAEYSFGMAEIVDSSLSITYSSKQRHGYDGVELEYVDAETGEPAFVACILPGNAGEKLKQLKREGIANHDQAFREGMFEAGVLEWRNRRAKFSTELDGGIPEYGALLAVSHEMFGAGVSGSVLDVVVDEVSGDQTLTLSEPVEFENGKSYAIALRGDHATLQGPFVAAQGANKHEVIVSAADNVQVYTGWRRQKTSFVFGESDRYAGHYLVRNAVHDGKHQYQLEGVYDDYRVHELDEQIEAGAISIPLPTATQQQELTQVAGIEVVYTGTNAEPVVHLSWHPVYGAEQYIVQYRTTDEWSTLAITKDLWLKKSVARGVAQIRIAAQDVAVGPWNTLDINPGTGGVQPVTPEGLALVGAFTGRACGIGWADDPSVDYWLVAVCETAANGGEQKRQVRVDLPESGVPRFEYSVEDARFDGLGRSFAFKVTAVAHNGELSPVAAELEVSNPQILTLGSVNVSATLRAAVVQVTRPLDTDFEGFRVWRGDTQFFIPDESTLVYRSTNDKVFSVPLEGSASFIKIAAMDAWGDDGLVISSAFEVPAAQMSEGELPDSIPGDRVDELNVDKLTGDIATFIQGNFGSIDVGSITGDVAAFIQANIANASIGSAKLAGTIQSDNYDENNGWAFDKNGLLVARDAIFSGLIEGAIIRGAIVDGGLFIGGANFTLPTDIDGGPGSNPRYLCYADAAFSASCSHNNWSNNSNFLAADYLGEGTKTEGGEVIANNYSRCDKASIIPNLSIAYSASGSGYAGYSDRLYYKVAIGIRDQDGNIFYFSPGTKNWYVPQGSPAAGATKTHSDGNIEFTITLGWTVTAQNSAASYYSPYVKGLTARVVSPVLFDGDGELECFVYCRYYCKNGSWQSPSTVMTMTYDNGQA